jgi:hypothetical protein
MQVMHALRKIELIWTFNDFVVAITCQKLCH